MPQRQARLVESVMVEGNAGRVQVSTPPHSVVLSACLMACVCVIHSQCCALHPHMPCMVVCRHLGSAACYDRVAVPMLAGGQPISTCKRHPAADRMPWQWHVRLSLFVYEAALQMASCCQQPAAVLAQAWALGWTLTAGPGWPI
jgi:hypothetical protein